MKVCATHRPQESLEDANQQALFSAIWGGTQKPNPTSGTVVPRKDSEQKPRRTAVPSEECQRARLKQSCLVFVFLLVRF